MALQIQDHNLCPYCDAPCLVYHNRSSGADTVQATCGADACRLAHQKWTQNETHPSSPKTRARVRQALDTVLEADNDYGLASRSVRDARRIRQLQARIVELERGRPRLVTAPPPIDVVTTPPVAKKRKKPAPPVDDTAAWLLSWTPPPPTVVERFHVLPPCAGDPILELALGARPAESHPLGWKPCAWPPCGNAFDSSERPKMIYCSDPCRALARKQNRRVAKQRKQVEAVLPLPTANDLLFRKFRRCVVMWRYWGLPEGVRRDMERMAALEQTGCGRGVLPVVTARSDSKGEAQENTRPATSER